MSMWTSLLFIGLLGQSVFCFAGVGDHPGKVADDSALIAAVRSHQRVFYVEAGNLTVTRLLPDDTSGNTHEKWEAQLSDGETVTIIFNTDADIGPRVPIQVGDKFGVGGQYIPTGRTGILHWLHDDPRHVRPDGYVYLNGVVYGDMDHEDN